MTEDRGKDLNIHRPPSGLEAELQREIDAALGDMSVEELIDAEAGTAPRDGDQGGGQRDARHGRVVAVHGEDIFVDMGGKNQGVITVSQFDEGQVPKAGDVIEVVVKGYDEADGLLLLGKPGAVQEASWETLEVGQLVEGRVTALNTGGLELNINGIRAFMPISQIELYRVEDLKGYINTKLTAKVMELKSKGRLSTVVVSRRQVLEEEMAKIRQETLAKLAEGQTVKGMVKSIMPYGAFVDIGGVDGLLHVSDMSWARVDNPSDVVKEGQQLEVMILKINPETKKISLGLKQVSPDPWTGVETRYQMDELVAGRVTRLAEFGAFVELESGVEGLIPMSELSFERRIKHPSSIVKQGDVVRVRVIGVDPARKRISLSLKRVGDDPWTGAAARWPADSVVDGIVTRTTDFGAFVEITPGVEGMVHISELSDKHVKSVSQAVSEGQTVKAKVLAVDEERRRISLSIKALLVQQAPAAAAESPSKPAEAAKRTKPLKGGLEFPGGGLSLGNLNDRKPKE